METSKFNNKEATTAQKFVDRLLTEGEDVTCYQTNVNNYELPEFYDKELFQRGQQFFWKYLHAVLSGILYGIMAILSIPSINKVFATTQKSSTDFSAYVRYTSVILQLYTWCKGDLKPGSKVWKSISMVNKIHIAASQKSKNGARPITQKDMALTQFSIVGFQLSRGEFVGLYNPAAEELEGFVHFWRVMGSLLGIDDRFNICSGSVEETKEICNLLIDRCFYPAVEEKNPDYLKLSNQVIRGLWSLVPIYRYEVVMNYLFSMLQPHTDRNTKNNNKNIQKDPYFKLNFLLTLHSSLLTLAIKLYRYSPVRHFLNAAAKTQFWLVQNFPIWAYYSFDSGKVVQVPTTRKQVENAISSWLKRAKERIKRRQN